MSIRKVEKPWGMEIIWAETDDYAAKRIIIKQGHRMSKQYHVEKEETIYVLNGVLFVEGEGSNVEEVKQGESFHVKPGQVHRFGARFSPVDMFEVSTNHLDDVVRLEDDYERE